MRFVKATSATYKWPKSFNLEDCPSLIDAYRQTEVDHIERRVQAPEFGADARVIWNPSWNCVQVSFWVFTQTFVPEDTFSKRKEADRASA